MKKTQQNLRKLTLKKEVISNLAQENFKGGELIVASMVEINYPEGDPPALTYSLSWGYRCIRSQGMRQNNPYDCGAEMSRYLHCADGIKTAGDTTASGFCGQ